MGKITIHASAEDLPQILAMVKDLEADVDVIVTSGGQAEAIAGLATEAARPDQQHDLGAGGEPQRPPRFSWDAKTWPLRPATPEELKLATYRLPAGAAGYSSEVSPVEAKLRTARVEEQYWVRPFIEEQIRVHGAEVVAGPAHLKYLRLMLPGPRRTGAYCYVTTRGFIDFRLPKSAAADCHHAFARDVKDVKAGGSPYAVRLRLNSDAAMVEALHLAAEAAART